MKNANHMTIEELKAALPDRIRSRKYAGASGSATRDVCWLDLRGKSWGQLGAVVLHDPSDPEWPEKGATTNDDAAARRWVVDHYAQWVHDNLKGDDPDLKVADAIEPFIQALHDDPTYGPDHSTSMSRRSYLRVHIGPALGDYRLATLPTTPVQTAIDAMEVRKSTYGVQRKEPASAAAREGALAALRALYRHHFPGRPIPFGGVKVSTRRQETARRKKMIREGRAHELIKKTSFTPDEIFMQLAAARFIDLHPDYGIIAEWACRIAAPTIALQVALGTRIAELVEMRMQDIDEIDGFALIAGSKSLAALRYTTLQDSARPWLRVLAEAKSGPSRPEHFLLRMHPQRDELPNKDVFARRMGKIAWLVDQKLPGARSHIYRATHSSWANMKGIPPHEIKLFLGHSNVFGGATDAYIQFVRKMARDEHRRYIDLPSPDAIDEFLATGWMPPRLRKRRGGGAPRPV